MVEEAPNPGLQPTGKNYVGSGVWPSREEVLSLPRASADRKSRIHMKVSSEVGPTDSFQRIEVKRHAPENPARNPAGTKVKTQRRPLEKPSESETALLNSASCRRELILMLEAHEEMHVKPHLVRYFQRQCRRSGAKCT